MTAEFYVVVVRGNLVVAIERSARPPDSPIPGSPLEVSSQLAANHKRHGCIDGTYYFDDAQRARIFATLCLGFTKAVAERRLTFIDSLPAGRAEYREDDESLGNRPTGGDG